MFQELSFRHPFRKYQGMILAQVEGQLGTKQDDHRYHIVAPPGSGKTIVGLELVRRFGMPAVVFAPTTTIQQQWQQKLGMFTSDTAQVAELSTLDPQRQAPIHIFTYQLISTAGEAQELGKAMAVRSWIEELIVEGKVANEAAARSRIETIRSNNPRDYDRELARRYLRVKHNLLSSDEADIASFLHPNARQLIQSLVSYGVRTVVLDECHHLLDYWAIVLRHLIRQIHEPRVVGLTATLPSPEDDEEYENYNSLLGEVDFEVPTPAVVKEGDLAPYRDLVYFVQPSHREHDYLRNIQQSFEEAIAHLTGSQSFRDWVAYIILKRLDTNGSLIAWDDFLNRYPLLSLAGLRFLKQIEHPIPPDLDVPVEANEEMTLEDWTGLLERYALGQLRVSADKEDHRQLAELRRVLLPFGLTLTEAGLRQGRSPGELVLALSESKDEAVARILAAEANTLGDRLRAVVVTDFERRSTGVQRLNEVLARDAGSAFRVFGHLVHDRDAEKLDPILVTGKTLLVDADHGQELLDHFNSYLRAQKLQAVCSYTPTDSPRIFEVTGDGRDWSSRVYVRMVTEAFEEGLTRCLVGTRGIFGEGWDSLSLNTLVDLTSVTTSTSVQQLRGRTIRKDPAWPRKVAHNWDVICVASRFERGNADLRRFAQRHARYWGIVPVSQSLQFLSDAATVLDSWTGGGGTPTLTDRPAGEPDLLGPQLSTQIVKGVSHVDPDLAFDLCTKKFTQINYAKYNQRMLRQVKHRDEAYELWGIGQEYSNFAYSATRLEAFDLKIRTVFTISSTLKRMLRAFIASLIAGVFFSFWLAFQSSATLAKSGLRWAATVFTVLFGVGVLVTLAWNARSAYRIARTFLKQQPPDAILLDVGKALLSALKDAGIISRNLQLDYVRVIEQTDNSYQVLLDYASPEDAAIFIRAYQQIFEPVREQRYLILRDDTRLPSVIFSRLWTVLRRWYRQVGEYEPAYHPVPDILASRKERAESFARCWQRYVGGGELVFTRKENGRKLLMKARTQRRSRAKSLAFEIWR
jgi:superfamily II DNA or RNA helicase